MVSYGGWRYLRDLACNLRGCVLRVLFSHDFSVGDLVVKTLGMDYRAKIDNPKWKKACDIALIVSGFIPPVIFGVGFGNLMIGVPFEFNELLMMSYQRWFLGSTHAIPTTMWLGELGDGCHARRGIPTDENDG